VTVIVVVVSVSEAESASLLEVSMEITLNVLDPIARLVVAMNIHVPLNVAGQNGVPGPLVPLILPVTPVSPRDPVNVSESPDVAVVDSQKNPNNVEDPFLVLLLLLQFLPLVKNKYFQPITAFFQFNNYCSAILV